MEDSEILLVTEVYKPTRNVWCGDCFSAAILEGMKCEVLLSFGFRSDPFGAIVLTALNHLKTDVASHKIKGTA